tara:strand:+ start:1156 stop:1449 length:294 start_codon:yes stop_codon:yes gene_type:complete
MVTKSQDTRFAQIKKNSPGVPPETCAYLDRIIEVVNDLSSLVRDEKKSVAEELNSLIQNEIDYVRAANDTLRNSSKYWYDNHKTLYYKKMRNRRKIK